MTRVVVIGKDAQQRQRWANDGGWTTLLAGHQAGADCSTTPLWRLSIAEIDQDGPFSILPGMARVLVLLDGGGLELRNTDDGDMSIDLRLASLRFCGSATVHCRLINGPVRVFNVMTRHGRIHAKVVARPLQGTMMLFADPGDTWLVYALAGNVDLGLEGETHRVGPNELLQMGQLATPTRMSLQGTGEVILVRVRAAVAA